MRRRGLADDRYAAFVLADQAAKDLARSDLAVVRSVVATGMRPAAAGPGPGAVLMSGILIQDCLQALRPCDGIRSVTSAGPCAPSVRHKRSPAGCAAGSSPPRYRLRKSAASNASVNCPAWSLWVRGHAENMDVTDAHPRYEEDVDAAQGDRAVDMEEVVRGMVGLPACAGTPATVGWLCCGAGGICSRFRTRRTSADALTQMPRPSSSSWTRRRPQPGFSRAICSISAASSASTGTRPPYLLGCARASRVRAREVRRCRYGSSPPAAGMAWGVLPPARLVREPLMGTCGLIADS